jgi:transcriptional regulator with XRE-family HTH domain
MTIKIVAATGRSMDERLASMSPDELRSAMRSLGYRTQNDLAQAIGVSRSAVSLWLEGKVGVPRPVAMLLRMLVSAQRRAYKPPSASERLRSSREAARRDGW